MNSHLYSGRSIRIEQNNKVFADSSLCKLSLIQAGIIFCITFQRSLMRILFLFFSTVTANEQGLMCYCQEHCPNNAYNNTCFVRPGGWCFKSIQTGEEGVHHNEPIV